MSNIELVIKISEKLYENIQSKSTEIQAGGYTVENAILNGALLPKGHGKIGDLDALRDEVSSWGMNDYEPLDFIDAIDEADIIIEADKAESEEV